MPDSTWIHSGTPEARGKMDLAMEWIKNHRETVIGSLVISGAAVIFGVWVAVHYSGLREAAWKSLFIAQQTGYSGNYAEATKQLDSIGTSYRKTSAWGFAALTKGDLLFRQNKFKEAADEYAKVAANGPKNLIPFASYSLGKAKEATADLSGAQKQYQDFLTAHPEHFLAPDAHFSLASIYELSNNQAEAKAAYEKIALLYPDTSWSAAAKAKLMPALKEDKGQTTAAVIKTPQAEAKK